VSCGLFQLGTLQLTMLATGLQQGKPFPLPARLDLLLCLGGLAYLVFPGLRTPPMDSAALMALAGIAWEPYSVHGRGNNPRRTTTATFMFAAPSDCYYEVG
jgi:hypothetical protein